MLESLHVDAVTPFDGWPYEWVTATATFAVAAADEPRIVDLDRAPADPDGLVRFESDVRLLRPTDGGNGRALQVVPNRGMVGGVPFSVDVSREMATPGAPPDAGDGFLLRRGWTIAWCGWQWDVLRNEGGLGLAAPIADVEPGWMRVEFRPDVVLATHTLGDSSAMFRFASYPTAELEDPEATLRVRTAPLGPATVVPRSQWRFSDDEHVELDGGFQPFHWYELVYRSRLAPVVGAGLLAFRDFGLHLRQEHDHVLTFGASQSGRFLRQLVHDGLNPFDGLFVHIASARRGEFNFRYAQPSLTHPLNPGYGSPYDTGSILARSPGHPKVMETNSSWEYWRGDGALVHQHPATGDDLPEHPDARVHLLAGTDHVGRLDMKGRMPVANPTHALDIGPAMRALFVQLEAWVCGGVEPPPSRVPRRAMGTAVERGEVLARFHDCALPDPACLPYTPEIDPTSTTRPVSLGAPAVALVSAVDATGNELAGIRLPAVAAPVASYTGWNPRRPIDGLPDVLYEMMGSRLPRQDGGSRPTRDEHAAAARAVADALVADRFLLAEDVERAVAEAMAEYDDPPAPAAPQAS